MTQIKICFSECLRDPAHLVINASFFHRRGFDPKFDRILLSLKKFVNCREAVRKVFLQAARGVWGHVPPENFEN